MEITRVDSKCVIKQANSSKTVESEVHEFKEKEKLVVVLNKSVKLNMVWNGKLYEGKMAGIDFISEGPKVTKTKTGR
jgi:hypothetical protein